MSGFCRHCGAGIPPRYGEGRCPECAPWAVRWHALMVAQREALDFAFNGLCAVVIAAVFFALLWLLSRIEVYF